MANWTYPIDTAHNIYPNINVYKALRDDVLTGWRITPHDGYVMYDTAAEDFDWGTMTPVTYYYARVEFPPTVDWNNFTWVAVPRSEVDANYIFDDSNNDHEVPSH